MKTTNILLMLILLLTILSCSTKININDYIENDSSITLSIDNTNPKTGLTNTEKREIKSNTEKFKKFREWGIKNQDNWRSTPASYITDIYITQGAFSLLYFNDFVVVSFINENGKGKQYSKSIKSAELDFLTDLDWKTFTDTVASEFTVTLKYPENCMAERIQNGLCVGKSINDSQNHATITTDWCIWMQDTSTCTIEHLISVEKSTFNEDISELRDSVIIENIKALRVTLKSSKNDEKYRQMIYLKKYSTLFEIIDNIGTDNGFDKFCNNIEINKMIKPSP